MGHRMVRLPWKKVTRFSVRKVKVMGRATSVMRRLQQTGCMEDSAISQMVTVMVSRVKSQVLVRGDHQVQVEVRDLLPHDPEKTFQLLRRKSTLAPRNLPETSTMPSWDGKARRLILKCVRSPKRQKRSPHQRV